MSSMSTTDKVRLCIWFGIGGLFTAHGIADAFYEYRLVHSGIKTMAVVTEKRYTSRSPLPGIYSVRYRYDGGGTLYTFEDFYGRTNLWASIPRTEYSETSRLPIQYLPDRPNLSRPTVTPPGYSDQTPMVVVGMIMIALGMVALRRARVRPQY
jgi:hypothetical protein